MRGDLIRFPWRADTLSAEAGKAAAELALATPRPVRGTQVNELHLEDPEQLLALCALLRRRLEMAPAEVLSDSEFFFEFLQNPKRPVGKFDERDYYLGELALLAGTACRLLAFRDRARRWFDRAESNFVLAHNSSAHVARVAYQRLAVRLEERQFDEVTELAERWFEAFQALGLPEDALKCEFLGAHALKETGRYEEAKAAFRKINERANELNNENLAAIAAENLFQIHAMLGEAEEGIRLARQAEPVFRRLDNRVNLAKLQVGVGYLLRSQGKVLESVAAYRGAQEQFADLGMQADVAANNLVIADLLLDAGQPAQAEWEIRAALPVIDELKLVPEGIAALQLLRDSVRRRQIDRQALRNLNGYFEELGS
jgi:tetratricopeptide (TPR) repeat protein